MRLSKFPINTTKETPNDAVVVSHKLMLRAGLIRKLAAGIYTWMPLGLRVAKKVENIVREEMNRAGALELLMPAVIPGELWQESGRWEKYGYELLRFKDRHKADFVFGPTHEEVITDLVRREIRSYRQLPVNFYQIQTKFRDERRPRFGVMRGREFLMKDAYSFHMDAADLEREYQNMREAYKRIFQRVGVDFRVVKADSGAIGGNKSEEFHVLANSGEDLLAVSDTSDYAANVEAAETRSSGKPRAAASQALEKVSTPGQKTVEQVSKFMNVPLTGKIKLLVVQARGGGLVAIALRGDHELNEIKAAKHPKISAPLTMADPAEVQQAFGCDTGYLGPVKCPIPVIADYAAAEIADFVCGANENDHHLKGANWGRDCAEPETADLRKVVEGDPSPDGQGKLKLLRGIEVGHIFQLGNVYTEKMKTTVLDAAGKEIVPESGCYGIGVTRTAAAVIEQRNDANGIIWPDAIAPFLVIVCPIGADKSAAVKQAADKLYEDLNAQGIEVLYDDRGQRPGAMFADADLIGIPHRIVVGDKSLASQQFEYKHRRESAPKMIPATAAAVLEILRG